jgi:hypothetical protein
MSNGKRIRGPHPYLNGRRAEYQPGDEQGAYSREQLVAMNARFVERVERAFKNGSERRESAAINGAAPTRLR